MLLFAFQTCHSVTQRIEFLLEDEKRQRVRATNSFTHLLEISKHELI